VAGGTQSDENGVYEIDLTPGEYLVSASSRDAFTPVGALPEKIRVPVDWDGDLVIEVVPMRRIVIAMRDLGSAEYTLSIVRVGEQYSARYGRISGTCTFRTHLPDGRYELTVGGSGGAGLQSRRFDVMGAPARLNL